METITEEKTYTLEELVPNTLEPLHIWVIGKPDITLCGLKLRMPINDKMVWMYPREKLCDACVAKSKFYLWGA